MSEQPRPWDPQAGQPGYPYDQPEQPPYVPPPPYGGYPPASYVTPAYGTQPYPLQPYGTQPYGVSPYAVPYGMPSEPRRPGGAVAAAVLGYIQAGLVLVSSFYVLALASLVPELIAVGVIQLISIGLLVFGAVQVTGGSGRRVMLVANGLQLALVLYYIIRLASFSAELQTSDFGHGALVFPLFYAVMPGVGIGLLMTAPVADWLAQKRSQ